MHLCEEPWVYRSLFRGNARSVQIGLERSCVNFPHHGMRYGSTTGNPMRQWRRGFTLKSLEKLQALKDINLSPSSGQGGGGSFSQSGNASRLTEEQIGVAVVSICDYVQKQRERYAAIAAPLRDHHGSTMKRFFSPELISRIRVAEVKSREIPEPLFYSKAKTMGIRNLPVLAHMASLTFVDVLVFTGPMTERDLFHALVHAAQFEVLGLMNWADLYVRGFLKLGRDFLVPIEIHAFALDTRFATNPARAFDVKSEISNWAKEGRYAVIPPTGPSAK
jgi:hypothetical protein